MYIYICSRNASLAKSWNYSIYWILCRNQKKIAFEWMNSKSVHGKNEAASLSTVDWSPQLGSRRQLDMKAHGPFDYFIHVSVSMWRKSQRPQALTTQKCVQIFIESMNILSMLVDHGYMNTCTVLFRRILGKGLHFHYRSNFFKKIHNS